MRQALITRKTAETDIRLKLDLDGTGKSLCDTGCGFLDHMLTLFARHGRFDLDVQCRGDTRVDYHHTTEDIGIALGQAAAQALGDKKGISRYGSMLLPMDEALVLCALDLSGRCTLRWNMDLPTPRVGILTRNWERSFSWPSPVPPRPRCTCGSWTAATATISWRRPSRPSAGPCGRR